jgi:hypothetical protein
MTACVRNFYAHHPDECIAGATCHEREGSRYRKTFLVYANRELEDFLWLKMKDLPCMFDAQGLKHRESLRALWDTNKMFLMIDNVGLVGIDLSTPSMPNVHVTFWDLKMRGREPIGIVTCQEIIKHLGVPALFTQMPSTSKATMAWTKRIGFKVINWYCASTYNRAGELDDLVELAYYDAL